MLLFSFYITVNWISLGFEQLVEQNKTSKDVILDSGILNYCIFMVSSHFGEKNLKKQHLVLASQIWGFAAFLGRLISFWVEYLKVLDKTRHPKTSHLILGAYTRVYFSIFWHLTKRKNFLSKKNCRLIKTENKFG